MLTRHQVMLTDWLADFLKQRAKRYDVSFSECIRVGLCMYYIQMIQIEHPEYTSKISFDDLIACLDSKTHLPKDDSCMHKMISDLYFETRKAMEFYKDQNPETVDEEKAQAKTKKKK